MAIMHFSGPAKTQAFTKKASTAIASGSAMGFEGGYVTQAEAASVIIAGISLNTVTSSSNDYASASLIPLIVPSDEDVFVADVGTGTATIANVGKLYDLSTNSDGTASSITLSGTSYKTVTVVGVISTTKVLVKINAHYAVANKAN